MKTSNEIHTKKIIKKSDKLTLRQMKLIEEAEDQLLQANTVNSPAPVVEVEEKPVAISQPRVPDYIPFVRSVDSKTVKAGLLDFYEIESQCPQVGISHN
ncbi:hypothetical protein, partial [Nostoc sp.]|uniref:hypothetical protein n=1 Tax=Nostoc sp. TaxID=1180 RepID=UPI002FF91B10